MRRVVAAVLGAGLIVATATPSWADASQFRLPDQPYNGYGQKPSQIGPRGSGGQRFNPGAAGQGRAYGGPGSVQGQRFGGDQGRGFGSRDGYRHHGNGVAIGAGLAGLAAGAVIGGALAGRNGPYNNGYDEDYDPGYRYAAPVYSSPTYAAPAYEEVEPVSSDTVAECAQRYRSYDPDSETYLGYDGERHSCP